MPRYSSPEPLQQRAISNESEKLRVRSVEQQQVSPDRQAWAAVSQQEPRCGVNPPNSLSRRTLPGWIAGSSQPRKGQRKRFQTWIMQTHDGLPGRAAQQSAGRIPPWSENAAGMETSAGSEVRQRPFSSLGAGGAFHSFTKVSLCAQTYIPGAKKAPAEQTGGLAPGQSQGLTGTLEKSARGRNDG